MAEKEYTERTDAYQNCRSSVHEITPTLSAAGGYGGGTKHGLHCTDRETMWRKKIPASFINEVVGGNRVGELELLGPNFVTIFQPTLSGFTHGNWLSVIWKFQKSSLNSVPWQVVANNSTGPMGVI